MTAQILWKIVTQEARSAGVVARAAVAATKAARAAVTVVEIGVVADVTAISVASARIAIR
jgi:hypothetical protein